MHGTLSGQAVASASYNNTQAQHMCQLLNGYNNARKVQTCSNGSTVRDTTQTLSGQQTPTEAAELVWSAAPVRAAHAAPSSVACTGVAPAEQHCGGTVLARLTQQGVSGGSPAQLAIEPICSARIQVNGNMPCVLCMRLDESGEC